MKRVPKLNMNAKEDKENTDTRQCPNPEAGVHSRMSDTEPSGPSTNWYLLCCLYPASSCFGELTGSVDVSTAKRRSLRRKKASNTGLEEGADGIGGVENEDPMANWADSIDKVLEDATSDKVMDDATSDNVLDDATTNKVQEDATDGFKDVKKTGEGASNNGNGEKDSGPVATPDAVCNIPIKADVITQRSLKLKAVAFSLDERSDYLKSLENALADELAKQLGEYTQSESTSSTPSESPPSELTDSTPSNSPEPEAQTPKESKQSIFRRKISRSASEPKPARSHSTGSGRFVNTKWSYTLEAKAKVIKGTKIKLFSGFNPMKKKQSP